MIQEQVAAAVITALISEKNKSRKKKENAKLWLEDEYNYKILFTNYFQKTWKKYFN